MFERLKRSFLMGLITIDEVYDEAKSAYYADEIRLDEYESAMKFCEQYGLTRTVVVYKRYKRIMGNISTGDLDPYDLKVGRTWAHSKTAMFRYCGKRIESAYREANYAKIRAHSRNKADLRRFLDNLDGKHRRADWTRKRWVSVGPSARVEIALQAEWDRARAEA